MSYTLADAITKAHLDYQIGTLEQRMRRYLCYTVLYASELSWVAAARMASALALAGLALRLARIGYTVRGFDREMLDSQSTAVPHCEP